MFTLESNELADDVCVFPNKGPDVLQKAYKRYSKGLKRVVTLDSSSSLTTDIVEIFTFPTECRNDMSTTVPTLSNFS